MLPVRALELVAASANASTSPVESQASQLRLSNASTSSVES